MLQSMHKGQKAQQHIKHAILGEIGHSLLVPKDLMRMEPKNAAAILGAVPTALPVGGKIREIVERMAEKAGIRMNVNRPLTPRRRSPV